MKVVQVVSHVDEEAAGPTPAVLSLCEALVQQGETVALHTMAAKKVPCGVELFVHEQWSSLGRFGFSLELVRSLMSASAAADIVHNHGLWAFPNMAAGLVAQQSGAKLLTSPHGTLAPAARARSRTKKLIFKPLQWPAITRAACLHATSSMEYDDIRELGLRNPVAIIPNGIDMPSLDFYDCAEPLNSSRRVLFLGRLHPIKGIEVLLNAWRTLQDAHPAWELVIAGVGDSTYVQSLQDMANNLRLERISFPGPVYGEDKRRLYCSSELFVLPTQTENFGMAIAEAQAHSVPVITTRGAPWPGLITNQSGWWVARTQDNITNALDEALRTDQLALKAMGVRGREWMKADFDWSSVAYQMSAVYHWLRDGGEPPSCIFLN